MKKFFFLILIFFTYLNSFSQVVPENEKLSLSSVSSDILGKYYKSNSLDRSLTSMPIDGLINPDEYNIGPNDLLEINIYGALPQNFVVQVSPEGLLNIPMIGEVNLSDLTLAKSRDLIKKVILSKYKNGSVSVILKKPRQFSVMVTGIVEPGFFIVSPFDRVDKLIFSSYKQLLSAKVEQKEIKQEIKKDQAKDEIRITSEVLTPEVFEKFPYFNNVGPTKAGNFSLRKIKIFRKKKDTLNVDLMQFYSTGDVKFNPYLQDGDIVFIPAEDVRGNYIQIMGEVQQPGVFEFIPTDRILTAIKLVQGFKDLADKKNIELFRFEDDWKKFNKTIINIQEIEKGASPNFELRKGDRIFVRSNKTVYDRKEVNLRGEIKKPGNYPIIKGVTKLSEIIEMSGGFTDYANLGECRIIRTEENMDEIYGDIKKYPEYSKLKNSKLGKLDKFEMELFAIEDRLKLSTVTADFIKLFIENNKDYDIVLEGGEEIYIPSTNNSIYVFGQVANSGYVTFIPGKDFSYYISKAGGYSEVALKKDAKVIKAKSRIWIDPSDTKIENGDMIYVPKEIARTSEDWFNLFTNIGSMIISLGTIVILILQNKK